MKNNQRSQEPDYSGKKGMAIGQVLLLILGIIAFGFIFGGEVKVVSAFPGDNCTKSQFENSEVIVKNNISYKCLKTKDGYQLYIYEAGLKVDANTNDVSKQDKTKKTIIPAILGGSYLFKKYGQKIFDKELKKNFPNLFQDSTKADVSFLKTPTDPYGFKEGLNALNKEISLNPITNDAVKVISDKVAEHEALLIKGQAAFDKAKAESLVANPGKEALARRAGERAYKKLTKEFYPKSKGIGVFLKNLKTSLTKNIFKGTASGAENAFSQGVAGGIYAAAGAFTTMMIFKGLGAGERNMKRIATATKIIAATGFTTFSTMGAFGAAIPEVGWIFLGAMAITALVSAVLYKNMSHEIFSYKLALWQPVSKGELCQQCNSDYDEYGGCSEYQCRTYGAACDIVNAGTKDELCDWINKNDMAPPIMNALDVLREGYRYNPDPTLGLKDKGVILEKEGKECLPAFEGVEFGISTDEPAQCKIDLNRTFNYDDMVGFMQEGSSYVYNHTFSIPNIALPSAYAINEAGLTIDEGNNYEFYMRCKDVNNNTSPFNFVVKFCVDDGPDTTAPEIKTNYIDNAYIRSDQVEINDLEVYTNEPATCRWDYSDRDYKDMSNEMTDCSTTLGQYTFPNSYSYGCRATLSGIKNNELNSYYIRCEDKPGLSQDSEETRISNTESYKLNLQGTSDLVIDDIMLNTDKPVYTTEDGQINGVVISDATQSVQVRIDVATSHGAGGEGNARCTYSNSGLKYEFYNNQNYDYTPVNNHYWHLEDNNYNYNIECCDVANNCDNQDISFRVKSDLTPPQVARAYHEDGLMKLVTDESAECVYSLSTCNYKIEDGLKVDSLDTLNHFMSWDEKESYYVKCSDAYGNYPNPSECSIVVRPQYEYDNVTA